MEDKEENNFIMHWRRVLEMIITIIKNDTSPLREILFTIQETISLKTKNSLFEKVKQNKHLMHDYRYMLKQVLIQTIIANGNLMDLEQIQKEQLEFPKERKISKLFKDFLQKTLEKDYKRRIGIKEALNHPWIQASKAIFDEKENLGCLENFLIKLITDNIANFNELIK